jgi:hypothetical protein
MRLLDGRRPCREGQGEDESSDCYTHRAGTIHELRIRLDAFGSWEKTLSAKDAKDAEEDQEQGGEGLGDVEATVRGKQTRGASCSPAKDASSHIRLLAYAPGELFWQGALNVP